MAWHVEHFKLDAHGGSRIALRQSVHWVVKGFCGWAQHMGTGGLYKLLQAAHMVGVVVRD